MVGTRRSSRNEQKNIHPQHAIPNEGDPEPTTKTVELTTNGRAAEEQNSTDADDKPVNPIAPEGEPTAGQNGDPAQEEDTLMKEEIHQPATTTSTPDGSVDDADGVSDDSERCPACPDEGARKVLKKHASKESWVACEGCQQWYHWDCVGEGGDLSTIDKWYCSSCLSSNPAFMITLKAPARKSARKRTQTNYVSLSEGLSSDPSKWIRLMQTKKIATDRFKRVEGSTVSIDWIKNDEDALKEPIVIENPEGLGMKMPGWTPVEGTEGVFGIRDVARLVGPDTPVEVIDVASQSTSPGWTLSKWADYYYTPAAERDKICNVISLEVSGTPLAEYIAPPRLVKDIDWTELVWPQNKKGKGQYPKVQLYCLMSVAQCWTDFHIDFAGSSVFYHVLKGAKVFYFIRPTKANLLAYEKWSGSEMQSTTWLGDLVDEVVKVELKEGHTMFIPTGWIHSVYTPVDSLVFGGNFLHSYNISTQLRVRDIEIATRVPKKFRFPFFQRMCWYAAEKFNRDLKAKEEFSPRVLDGLRSLSDFLVSEARLIERSANGNETARREAKEQVPSDKVKDAPALAREFRWRVNLAVNGDSGDERPASNGISKGGQIQVPRSKSAGSSSTTGKRKRGASQTIEDDAGDSQPLRRQAEIFKNFEPRPWDEIRKSAGQLHTSNGATTPEWTGEEQRQRKHTGTMETMTNSIIKTRRYEDKLGRIVHERETITRIRETWASGSTDKIAMELD